MEENQIKNIRQRIGLSINNILNSHQSQWLLMCIVLATFVRILYLNDIAKIPFFEHPVGDAKIYFDRAKEILHGKILPEEVSFHSSPIYPYFIAITYAPFKTLTGVRIIQMLTGILNIIIVYLIISAIFGTGPACIGAFILSIYPVFIYFEGDLMMISLVIFTLNISCLMFIRYQKTRKKPWLIAGGILLGLSALGKPDTIMIFPFIGTWIFFTEPTYKQGLLRVCFLALWGIATILPCTATNYILHKEFMLLTSNGGVNFFIGNHAGANGMFHLPKQSGLWDHKLYSSSKEVAQHAENKILTPVEVSRYWFKRSVQFIKKNPLPFLILFGKKMLLIINQAEVSNHHSFYFFKRYSYTLRCLALNLSIIMFFFIIGFLEAWKMRSNAIIILIYLGVTFFFSTLFFVTSRYRLPTVTFFIIFASAGIYRFYRYSVEKNWRKLIKISIPGLIFFVLSLIPLSGYPYSFSQDYNNLGNVYIQLGNYDKAIQCYKRNLQGNPRSLFTHFNLGNTYAKLGKPDMALSEFIQEIEINPRFAGSYINIAREYMDIGQLERARTYLEKLSEQKFTYDGMFNLAYVYHELNQTDKAIDVYKKMLQYFPKDKKIQANLKICYKELKTETP